MPGQEEIEDLASLLRIHLLEEDGVNSVPSHFKEENAKSDIVQSLRGMGTNLHSGSNSLVSGVLVCALYAALPPEMQMLAFRPNPQGCTRKIVLATNIAETSVTLQGIKFVVDTGKHKMRQFSGVTGMEFLRIADVSMAQVCRRYPLRCKISSYKATCKL